MTAETLWAIVGACGAALLLGGAAVFFLFRSGKCTRRAPLLAEEGIAEAGEVKELDREASQSTDEGSRGKSSLWSSELDSSMSKRSSSKGSRSARSSSSAASRYMEQLSERYFNGDLEEKRGILREAQEAEVNAERYFILLQHALKSEPALAADAVQYVTTLVVSDGTGQVLKVLARDLLLACHEQHHSKEVRIKAIKCTGELLTSSSPDDREKALGALQNTLGKLMGKPDSQEEATAVVETYKEATGEDLPLQDKKRARDL